MRLQALLFVTIGVIAFIEASPSYASDNTIYQAILCDITEPSVDSTLDQIDTYLLSVNSAPIEFFAVTEGDNTEKMTLTFVNFTGDPVVLRTALFNVARKHDLTIAFKWLETSHNPDSASCEN